MGIHWLGICFYFLLLIKYATANNPVIENIVSNPGCSSSGVGVGVDVGVASCNGNVGSISNAFLNASSASSYLPKDLRAIINAAAIWGNKAYGFGVHVWAVDARYKGWRPGDGPFYCEATARYGKIEDNSCR